MNLGQTNSSIETLRSRGGKLISVVKYHFVFQTWPGPHEFDTYGGKQILALNDEPLFAELLVLRLLERQGYTGVWVDTYRKKYWQRLPCLSGPVVPDAKISEAIRRIYEIKGGPKSGCFDVVAFCDDHFVFAELKKQNGDRIRPGQIEWLEAALSAGLKAPTFLIAEWRV